MYMSRINQYIAHYLEYLEEAWADLAHLLELESESKVLSSFIITAMILTPIFGTMLFLLILVFGA